MIEEIFATLPELFVKDALTEPVSYYFSLGDIKITVRLSPEDCLVESGRTIDQADCVCKTDPAFFQQIWLEGYRPGPADFFSGKIKTNNPVALQQFLHCFGKEA